MTSNHRGSIGPGGLFTIGMAVMHATMGGTSPVSIRSSNGLAITPPMGWNSYNHYSCSANESVIMSNARALVTLDLDKLGYTYVTPDCGWAAQNRLANGSITWDPKYYPSGFIALGTFVHDLGLKFGVYSDAGIRMCSTGTVNNGSLNHETMDAATFVSWGADALKYDDCYSEASQGYPNVVYNPPDSPSTRYSTMKSALAATGRAVLFQICEWGVDFPSLWAPALGNTWRITNDITPTFSSVFRIMNQFVPSASFAGPGQWPDLDMLEVGNNIFTQAEEQTHFSLWAIAKSPLTIGGVLNDSYNSISSSSLAILSNTRIIGYNQDSLGKAASLNRRYSNGLYDIWSGPLSGGRTVVAIVNWANNQATVDFNLPDIGFQYASSAYDVWPQKATTNVLTHYTTTLAPHGVTVLELNGTSAAGVYLASLFATTHKADVTFTNIYGITTSASYLVLINLATPLHKKRNIKLRSSASATVVEVPLAKGVTSFTATVPFTTGNDNTLQITIGTNNIISSLSVATPLSTFYNASSFTLSHQAVFVTCPSGSCLPIGTKIGYLGDNIGTATLSVPYTGPALTTPATKHVEVTYCNNDIAFDGSWSGQPNSRNVTLQVNGGPIARLETPLSANVSEIFGWNNGYGSCATLGVDVQGFGTGSGGADTLLMGNVGGSSGYTAYAPDIVGLRIFG